MSSWLDKDVAEAQAEVAERALASTPWPDVYLHFAECVDTIGAEYVTSILDIGCGVGHYARVCKHLWPHMRYIGTDLSPFMIKIAAEAAPEAVFRVTDFYENDFNEADLVLIAGSMEYAYNPSGAMVHALNATNGYLILHRLHLTDTVAHEILEPTYCGNYEMKMLWNRGGVLKTARDCGRTVLHTCFWGNMMSVVIDAR
jgi:trans-aconitate methyltransferase